MKIVLASRNKKKIAEMKVLLGELCNKEIDVLSLDDIGFTDDIVEDGETFKENALIKASTPASLGYIGVSDDSGLCVDYLDGAPGVYSARFSGEDGDDEKNNDKLLSLLDKVEDDKRGAGYVCTVAFVVPEGAEIDLPDALCDKEASEIATARANRPCKAFTVYGECRGKIIRERTGCGGFGYDPLFSSDDVGKTFAEIDGEEKNKYSHRGRAMRAFAEALNTL